jgi:cytochrome c553
MLSLLLLAALPADLEHFEKNVRPVLIDKCVACHGPSKQRGGLRMDSRAALLKGGDSGPALIPGDPTKSLMLKAIRWEGDLKMPQKEADRLTPTQIAAVEAWIKSGAAWPDEKTPRPAPSAVAEARKSHWSYQPIGRPTPPTVDASHPVDAFLVAKLRDQKLTPASEADRRTLLRRLSFDLIGLPPTPEEIAAFEADTRPDAYERQVDRLLASPHHGERWARHWLDVARYADTKGYVFQEERRYPYSYTYRDYVIRALNEDRPYDRFVIEQLAADKLELGDDKRPLAAMGFLTLGRRFLNNTHDIIDDRIDVVTRGLLGLTVSCARCHDHKYDAIPARDYYSLYGVFASSLEPGDLPLIGDPATGADAAKFQAELAKRETALKTYNDSQRAVLIERYRARAGEYLVAANTPMGGGRPADFNPAMLQRWRTWLQNVRNAKTHPDLLAALAGPEPAAAVQKLVKPGSFQAKGEPLDLPENLEPLFDRAQRNRSRQLRTQVDQWKATAPGAPTRAMVLVDAPTPNNPYVFLRGNPGNRGVSVPRQFLEVLSENRKPFTQGSGRLELARAIASPDNPLTARVIANRLWMHHFGQGIVRTPGDFGIRGEPPTHPELLDWLARQLIDNGWSLKHLHRLIVTSAAYRQRSDVTTGEAVDPENRLWWKYPRRRLELEPLRDAMLAVSGNLETTMGGKPVDITVAPYPLRRSVYAFIERQNLPGVFRTFDLASPDASTPQRHATTVPQQALFLMNSPFAQQQARAFANRADLVGLPEEARIERMFRLAFGRSPDVEEKQLAKAFIQDAGPSGWEQYAQVLLSGNEFAFVD